MLCSCMAESDYQTVELVPDDPSYATHNREVLNTALSEQADTRIYVPNGDYYIDQPILWIGDKDGIDRTLWFKLDGTLHATPDLVGTNLLQLRASTAVSWSKGTAYVFGSGGIDITEGTTGNPSNVGYGNLGALSIGMLNYTSIDGLHFKGDPVSADSLISFSAYEVVLQNNHLEGSYDAMIYGSGRYDANNNSIAVRTLVAGNTFIGHGVNSVGLVLKRELSDADVVGNNFKNCQVAIGLVGVSDNSTHPFPPIRASVWNNTATLSGVPNGQFIIVDWSEGSEIYDNTVDGYWKAFRLTNTINTNTYNNTLNNVGVPYTDTEELRTYGSQQHSRPPQNNTYTP